MARRIIPLLVFLAVELYAFQAIRAWVSPYRPAVRRLTYGLYWAVSAAVFGLFLLAVTGQTADWGRGVRIFTFSAAFIALVSKLPVVLLLLVDDLRRGGGWLLNRLSPVTPRDTGRSRFLAGLALAAGGVPLATLTYGIVRNAYRYRLHRQDVAIAGLPAALDGFRIVQISDMHSGSWTRQEPLRGAVDLINAEAADLVCMTGDLVNSRADEMEPFVPIFREIRARHGVVSVMGNHDYGDYERGWNDAQRAANLERFYATHRELGWDLLRDEHRKIRVGGATLGVLGVENWSALRFGARGDLAAAHAGTDDCDCRLLLSHDPTHWDAQVRPDFPDIDLTLSGHTHGFQFGVEIPGFRWSPAQYMYKQWAGLYREGGQQLYVNRGLGFLGYPGRVGILPEITVLTLRRPA